MAVAMLFAQAPVNPEWLGLIIQLGSFGAVMAIIFSLWPKERERQRTADQERDERFEKLLMHIETEYNKNLDRFLAELKEQRATFDNILKEYRSHSAKLAEEGHEAVKHLAEKTDNLAKAINGFHQ